MNLGVVSIFNLSPPEKLQLVEDLWDDLAATPSEVPVHEWQKEELARRKVNLMSKPASGLSWDEVKHRVRSLAMVAELIIAPEAQQDVDEAYCWYENRRLGLCLKKGD